ncbi:MAG: GNAT family N-acetyltransferase [Leptolinea sp.]|jgi:GNAT superfamily N-acetyltransferase|nr:GNAT family N-acetyltransferase [Leptolinea sp.]
MNIRLANTSDDRLLAELGARTFADSFSAENTPEDMAAYLAGAFSPEKQAAELADPRSVFLIAEEDGQPVGYARLKLGPAPECVTADRPIEIVRFYAIKEMIGRGVGAALMTACLDEARDRGSDVAWLDVWEKNPRAITFYRKWGFEKVGEQDFQLGDDLQNDWLMSRKI